MLGSLFRLFSNQRKNITKPKELLVYLTSHKNNIVNRLSDTERRKDNYVLQFANLALLVETVCKLTKNSKAGTYSLVWLSNIEIENKEIRLDEYLLDLDRYYLRDKRLHDELDKLIKSLNHYESLPDASSEKIFLNRVYVPLLSDVITLVKI